MKKIDIKFSNVHCQSCTKIISRKLSTIDGVSGISINVDGTGNIISNKDIKLDQIESALLGTEYKVLDFKN